MDRQALIDERVTQIVHGFPDYVMGYDQLVPFTSEQLTARRSPCAARLAA